MSRIILSMMQRTVYCILNKKLAEAESKVIFGGRLGEYKYYDMDQVIAAVLDKCASELGEA